MDANREPFIAAIRKKSDNYDNTEGMVYRGKDGPQLSRAGRRVEGKGRVKSRF
jgi:hypothetical protein